MTTNEYMRRYMKKYLQIPENAEKNRIRALEYAAKHRKKKHWWDRRYCKYCNKQIYPPKQRWCNRLCQQRFRTGYPKCPVGHGKPKKTKEEKIAYQKDYWEIPENKARRKAQLKALNSRRRIKRIKRLEILLKRLKANQLEYEN